MKKIFALSAIPVMFLWGLENLRLSADINTGLEYYRYTEPKIKISGPMYVLNGSLGASSGILKAQIDGYYATHIQQNVYDGQFFDGRPTQVKSTEWYAATNLKFGLLHSVQNKDLAFAYAGVGYRFLHNFTLDSPGTISSYARQQGYVYLPFGIDAEIPLTPAFSFTASSEYRYLIYGHHTAEMSRVGYDKNYNFKQNHGVGGRLALGVKIKSRYTDLKATFYYDFWRIEDSNVQETSKNGVAGDPIIEPRNRTDAFGLTIGASL